MLKARHSWLLVALLAALTPLHLTSCGNTGGPNGGSGGDGGDGGGGGGGGGGGDGGGGGGGSNDGSILGMGLAEVNSWTTQLPWVDAFKTSEPFLHQREGQWEVNEPLDLRPDGYPRSLPSGHWAGSVMFAGNEGHYPGGNYTCLYEGKGKIEFAWQGEVISSQPGRLIVKVTPTGTGVWLKLVETDPSDPVRNIRFILPGFESTYQDKPWHPDFIARWQPFKVLRFQEWLRTNHSKVKEWADRTPAVFQTQAAKTGVSWETVISLANTLKIDPWICIPHQASDDYIRKCAALFKEKLDPALKIYLEYSNEVWNGGFDQHHWCNEQGVRLGLDSDPWVAGMRFISQRCVFIFEAFEAAFGSTARLHRTLPAHSANSWQGENIAKWKDAYKKADSFAIAPYFAGDYGGPETQAAVSRMSVTQLLDAIDSELDRGVRDIDQYRALGDPLGLEVIAYEGGQHLVGYAGVENNDTITKLFTDANRHPRMEQLYDKYLASWKAKGGGMFVLFNSTMGYSKWGSWGTFEFSDQDASSAPKYRSMLKFIAANKKK